MQKEKLISNILAGVLIAVMNVTVAISVAALMFANTRPEFLAPGIVVLLIGTVVMGLGGTLFCGFEGVVCAPRSGLAPVFAAIVSGIYLKLGHGSPEQVLPSILIAIMLTSMVTGIFLLFLGRMKLGSLVRYIPYPVMGGFFAGIGFIFVKGGLTVAMGRSPGMDVINDLHLVQLAAPAVVFAISLYLIQRTLDHWAVFPASLGLAFIVFYFIFHQTGLNFTDAAAAGWLPSIGSSPDILFPVLSPSDLGKVDWLAILQQSGGILVVALLSAIMLLLDLSGIEIITRRDLAPDRELQVAGVTNIVSGIFGGYPGVHVASDTAFTYKLGGRSRLMGFVYAGAVLLTIIAGTGFIGKVPTFILGGLLIYVGLDFLVDWLWKSRTELPLSDYLIILVILAVIASVDILPGVAFGFAVAVILFVINYSRLSVVKHEATGRDHASNVDRTLQMRERLNQEGERILILTLQGFIFFGTSDKLISMIRERIEDRGDTRLEFLVLDFHHVSQIDSSAVKAFSKLAQLSEKYGFHIVITGADEDLRQRLDSIQFITDKTAKWQHLKYDQLDEGVAWCEEQILTELDLEMAGISENLVSMLKLLLEDADAAKVLAPYFQEEEWTAEHYLFHQGDKGDSLYLVGSGSVAVVIKAAGKNRVLRRYQSGAVLGEMAVYTGERRSASVLIEEDTVLYRLDAAQLAKVQQENSSAASMLHAYIIRLLSERLSRANRELQRYL